MSTIVAAAPGWWVTVTTRRDDDGEDYTRREPVAAFQANGSGVLQAMIGGTEGALISALGYYGPDNTGDVWHESMPPFCYCPSRVGSDSDQAWCPSCSGLIR